MESELDLDKYKKIYPQHGNTYMQCSELHFFDLIKEVEKLRGTVGAVHAAKQAERIKTLEGEVEGLQWELAYGEDL